MGVDTSIPFRALPQNGLFQSYAAGQQAAQQNQLARADMGQMTAQAIARGVIESPNPAQAYPQALRAAQQMGMDVSAFPQEWNEQAEMMTRMAAMPERELSEFERTIQALPPEEQMLARRVKLGLAPQAQAPEVRSVGNELVEVGPGGARSIYQGGQETIKPPAGYRLTEDGNFEYVPGGPEDPATIAGQEQAKAGSPTPYTDLGKLNADLNRGIISPEDYAAARSEMRKTGPDVEGESKIRKEFNALTEDFRKVRDAHARVMASAEDPSAAGDLALIFNYMKVLDPGSVVRESEFATAANSAGVPERVRAQYNRVLGGERLSDKTRDDFVNRSQRLYSAQERQYERDVEKYRGIAGQYGYDPNRAVPSGVGEGAGAPGPQRGGDPAIARGEELEAQGKTDAEIVQQLRAEGLIP